MDSVIIWRDWVFGGLGAVAALVAIIGWIKLKPKTSNTIINGDHSSQEGGAGTTENRIEGGSHNKQKG